MSIFETESYNNFKASLSSNAQVYQPHDQNYEQARVSWNLDYTGKPSMIIWCATAEDVSNAVKFLVANNLEFTVAGGRHSRFCIRDGIPQINLGGLNRVQVDPENRLATVQGGARNGDFDLECGKYGLHSPAGTNPDTGVGGLICGGGYGYLSVTYGFSVDNVVEVQIVTADGNIRRANEKENSDLFWGVRGAGFNFGIVTSFTLRVYPIGHVERPLTEADQEVITKYSLPDQSALVNKIWGGMLIYPWPLAKAAIAEVNAFAKNPNSPKDTAVGCAVVNGPHGPALAKVIACFGNDIYEGARIVANLRGENSEVKPVMDMVQPMTYVELQKLLEPKQQPGNYHERSVMLQELSPQVVDILLEKFANRPSGAADSSFVTLPFYVGKPLNIDPLSTSLSPSTRSSQFWIAAVMKFEEEGRESGLQWINDVKESLRPFATAYYINSIDGDDNITDLFPVKDLYTRLRTLKTKYDPQNIFHFNNNILPL